MIGLAYGCLMSAIVLIVFAQLDDEVSRIQADENIERSDAFPCRYPQPRSFPFSKLNGRKRVASEDDIFPPSAVLYRCEAAGCCPSQLDCKVEKSESITLVFEIIGDKPTYKHLLVRNDTLCSCQKRTNSPK